MKKNISIILILGMIISIYYNFQLKEYKDIQKAAYLIKLNHGIEVGIKESIQNFDSVIKSLEDNSPMETIIYKLGNIAASLRVGEESFVFLDPDFKEDKLSTTYLIYSVFRDIYLYIRVEILDDILTNKGLLEQESRSQLVKEIGILKQDLEYISKQFNEEILNEQSPKWIENKWKQLIGEIINKNPNFKLYERMRMKYNL